MDLKNINVLCLKKRCGGVSAIGHSPTPFFCFFSLFFVFREKLLAAIGTGVLMGKIECLCVVIDL